MCFQKNFRYAVQSSWIVYLHNYSFSRISTLSNLYGKLQLYFEKITELVVTGADSQFVQGCFCQFGHRLGPSPSCVARGGLTPSLSPLEGM
jgi:hypothetical protein